MAHGVGGGAGVVVVVRRGGFGKQERVGRHRTKNKADEKSVNRAHLIFVQPTKLHLFPLRFRLRVREYALGIR